MRVLVCGGRDFTDEEWLYSVLDALDPQPHVIIQGGAEGADMMAWKWAFQRGVICSTFFAAWDLYGRSAGPRRNQQMLDTGKPDLVIAFPGGRGTADMVRKAEAAGVPVMRAEKAKDHAW